MKCHQYKIREKKEKEKPNTLFGKYWEKLDLDLKKAIVKSVPKKMAERIILEYEWLGTMANTTHHYGIFFDNVCGGVVCFGRACTANFNVPIEFGLTVKEVYTLARGACVHWSPKGSASKLIATALKLLKRDDPNVKVVIAYSDVNAGEIGTVYQATNWYYIGKSKRVTVNYYNEKLNRRFDERMLHEFKKEWGVSRGEVKKRLLKEGWKIEPKAIKHKYIFILGTHKEKKEILKKVTILPYPKRNIAKEVSRVKRLPTKQEGRVQFSDFAPEK